ncbi:MAG: hypothetical protein IPJ65_28115 [Archangiaceae bacterium]|nr:hypothetical protein [Archangiaceae bacterium]
MAQRKKYWPRTLERVRALIDEADPEPWRGKKTRLVPKQSTGKDTVDW